MRVPLAPSAATITGLVTWARSFATAVASGWNVDHNVDGTHKFTWISLPFVATDFKGSGAMTWTPAAGLVSRSYMVRATTMRLDVEVLASSVSGSAVYLTMQLPAGYKAARRASGACAIADNGTEGPGWWVVTPGENLVRFARRVNVALNWTASVSNTYVAASMEFEVTK